MLRRRVGWSVYLSFYPPSIYLDRLTLHPLSGLELAVETRLASNSKRSICFFQVAGIEFVIFENINGIDKQKLDNYIGQELCELFWGGSDQ